MVTDRLKKEQQRPFHVNYELLGGELKMLSSYLRGTMIRACHSLAIVHR